MQENTAATAKSESPEQPPAATEWAGVIGLPCVLSLNLSVAGFRVRNLLSLDAGSVVDTHHNATSHVPVWVNGVKVGMAEFDVARTRLAIRLSEMD